MGFDNERHVYGEERYPAQLVLQDVLTIHGRQFKDAALIVASPPCQAYSYRAMPWKRAKALPPPSNALFDACFRIQREAIDAAGHFIPLVVENVRGAQPYVGRSKYHFGSFHLWGDVPALMPMARGKVKVPGISFSGYGTPGYKPVAFNGTADKRLRDAEGQKLPGNNAPRLWAERRIQRLADATRHQADAFYCSSSGGVARKRASAMIAKIPLVLSRHIAAAWFPVNDGAHLDADCAVDPVVRAPHFTSTRDATSLSSSTFNHVRAQGEPT